MTERYRTIVASVDRSPWMRRGSGAYYVPEEEAERLRAENKRLRRDVLAVIREWQDYPASYPRAAFIEDLRKALR